ELSAELKDVLVGVNTTDPSELDSPDYWHETIDPEALDPLNIYLAQMAYRSRPLPEDMPFSMGMLPRESGEPLYIFPSESPSVSSVEDKRDINFYSESPELFDRAPNQNMVRTWNGNRIYTYLKFDLSVLDIDGIDSAKLEFFNDNMFASGETDPANKITIEYFVDDTWVETELTFNNQPSPSADEAEFPFVDVKDWMEFDVSSFVQDAFNGDQTLTLKIGIEGSGTIFLPRKLSLSPALFVFPSENMPAAPTGLVASASAGSVSLDWNDNAEDDLAGYSVYRSTTSGGGYSEITNSLTASETSDNSVSNGTAYYYVVTAVNTDGNESIESREVFAIPAAPGNNPPAFTSDPVVEANAQEGEVYIATIADNASDPESDPMLFSKVSGPDWLSVASGGGLSGTPGSTDTGLNSFTVRVDAAGGSDTVTLEITVDADTTPPAAPTGLAATASAGSAVSLDWNDNAEGDLAGYSVYRSTTSGDAYSEIATGLIASETIDNSVSNSTTYYYVVTATDTSGNESAESSQAAATTPTLNIINVINPGFEEPGYETNKKDGSGNDWDGIDDVPGWDNAGSSYTDSGTTDEKVDAGSYSGKIGGYFNDDGVFQLTGHTIAADEKFTLSFRARDVWSSGVKINKAILYYDDPSNVIGTLDFEAPEESFSEFTLTATAPTGSVGGTLGIYFEAAGSGGTASSGVFLLLDEVSLSVAGGEPPLEGYDRWADGYGVGAA
ncbi:MAG TPA: DNRLRE domain-containing protein, partial [Tichowtungia sp.]|nr:DNRLRE domain-containing protein [Tichowtungia sp.]